MAAAQEMQVAPLNSVASGIVQCIVIGMDVLFLHSNSVDTSNS